MKINYDAPFWKRMEKLYYIIILNFLCLLFSLPIVTIGPSTAALYKTTFSLINDEEIHTFRFFYRAFQYKFLRNTFAGIILIGFTIVLFLGQGFYLSLANQYSNIIFYIYMFVIFLFIIFVIYIFPVLTVFDRTLLDSFRLTIFLSIKYLPLSILMAIINFLIIYFCQLVIPLTLIAAALIAFINCNLIHRKVFIHEIKQ